MQRPTRRGRGFPTSPASTAFRRCLRASTTCARKNRASKPTPPISKCKCSRPFASISTWRSGQVSETDRSFGVGAAADHRKRDGRHGRREQAYRRTAAQRPQLSSTGFAGAEHLHGLPVARARRDRGRAASARRQSIAVAGQRSSFNHYSLGWRREHRSELQHVRDPAVDRRTAGIQGADRRSTRPSSAARPHRSTC